MLRAGAETYQAPAVGEVNVVVDPQSSRLQLLEPFNAWDGKDIEVGPPWSRGGCHHCGWWMSSWWMSRVPPLCTGSGSITLCWSAGYLSPRIEPWLCYGGVGFEVIVLMTTAVAIVGTLAVWNMPEGEAF